MPKQTHHVYQSFLVRCWLILPATSDESPTWRFELREVSAEAQKHTFSDLEQLKNFIAAELAAIAAGNEPDSDKEDSPKGGES